MSESLAQVEERLGTVAELHEIVGALRALAATRTQQGEAALAATRAYGGTVADALGRVAALLPPVPPMQGAGGSVGLVVFCAEHGFAGAFNHRLLDAVGRAPETELFIVGARGAALARERGLAPVWAAPMATQVGALGATARRIADALFRRFAAGTIGGIAILYARHDGGERFEIARERLLPVEPAASRPSGGPPPLTNVPPEALLHRLVEAYFFAELMRAATESFTSENAARLASMQSARRNIEEKLDELQSARLRLRQEEITAELLDVVTGAAAQEQPQAEGGLANAR